MQIDKNLIQGKIDLIERDLEFLKGYKKLSIKEFLNNFKDIQAVKYSLLEIIEACIDIGAHMVSINNLERPKTYAEIFELLGQNKIINLKLSKNLTNMARFRNILVHSYNKVNDSKILEYIKKDLDNVKDFIKSILTLI